MIIDTHCHLTLCEQFDIATHIEKARAAGVTKILDPGLWVTDFKERYQKLHSYSEILFGLACAPHYRGASQEKEDIEEIISAMEEVLDNYPVAALSEIGLDYFHQVRIRESQHVLFRRQLLLARERDLPVFLHVRDAYEDAFRLVSESGHRRGAVHCFTGTADDADKFVDWGFYLSFSGIVTFKQSDKMRETVKTIPEERILTETDSPFLTPVPLRGKPNEAANVVHVNHVIAEVKGWDMETCHSRLKSNAQSLLGIDL